MALEVVSMSPARMPYFFRSLGEKWNRHKLRSPSAISGSQLVLNFTVKEKNQVEPLRRQFSNVVNGTREATALEQTLHHHYQREHCKALWEV